MIPTTRGFLLLLLPAPLFALAAWEPAMRWMALGLLLVLLAIFFADWRLAGDARRFTLARRHDNRLSLGIDNPVTVTLQNTGRRPAQVWLRDEPPDAFVIERRILEGVCAALEKLELVYHVRPLRRGDYRFGDLNLRWLSPLGLLVRQVRVPAAAAVKVYPNLLDVRRYDLLIKNNRLLEMGLRSSRFYGEGSEFERLREYQPDDEFRRIDWKASARRRRPVTVEYQVERSQNVIAVVETGRMMQSPVGQVVKLDYVINAVLLLAYVATGKGDKVGLMTFADDVRQYLSPRQGRGQFYRMLEMLYAVEAQPVEPDYARALSYLALRQRKRSLVIIFTDLSGGMSMDALTAQAAALAKRSLPLVAAISEPDFHTAAGQIPTDSFTVYQRLIASQLLDERKLALDHLRRRGVLTLDTPANKLSAAVINRYLELKARSVI